MSATNGIYDEFLSELSGLDDLLQNRDDEAARSAAAPSEGANFHATNAPRDLRREILPLSRHDPDVRRLLEGMAYLSARTRVLAVQGLRYAVDRLIRGYFDFLLAAMPAATLIRVLPPERLEKPLMLPRDTPIRLETPEGAVGFFRTTRSLTVLPLEIRGSRWVHRSREQRRFAIVIHKRGSIPEGKLDDRLSLRINDLDHYHYSRTLLGFIEDSLRGVSVAFDPPQNMDDPESVPCRFHFGIPLNEEVPEDDRRVDPLARVRSFFHFPQQALFFNIALPPLPGSWTRAVIYLDFDENWPADASLNDDTFRLFEVPVVNLRDDIARPILCDGTKEAYLIEGVNPVARGGLDDRPGEAVELHAISGVYKESPRGFEPIAAAQLTDRDDSYEVEEDGDDPDHLRRRLLLQIKGAFEKPVRVQVRGTWYQPGFDAVARSRLRATLQKRRIEDLHLSLDGDVEPHRPSPLWNDPRKLLHLLSLRTETRLTCEQVLGLLSLLGADPQSYHAEAVNLVTDIELREAASAGPRIDGICYRYQLVLRPYPPSQQGLVDDLVEQVHTLLDAWLPGAVEVTASAPSNAKRLPAGRSRG